VCTEKFGSPNKLNRKQQNKKRKFLGQIVKSIAKNEHLSVCKKSTLQKMLPNREITFKKGASCDRCYKKCTFKIQASQFYFAI